MAHEKDWHAARGSVRRGPFSGAEIRQAAAAGTLLPTDLVKRGGSEWVAASEVKGLFPVRSAPPRAPDLGAGKFEEAGPPKATGESNGGSRPGRLIAVAIAAVVCAGAAIVLLVEGPLASMDSRAVAVVPSPTPPGPPVSPVTNSPTGGAPAPALSDLLPPQGRPSIVPPSGTAGPDASTPHPAPLDPVPAGQPGSGSPPLNVPASEKPRGLDAHGSTVLGLLSAEYELNGQRHPHNYQPEPFIAAMGSADPGVRRLAGMGAAFIVDASKENVAKLLRQWDAERLFGGGDRPETEAPTPEVASAIARSAALGDLQDYDQFDSLRNAVAVLSQTSDDAIADGFRHTANQYVTELFLIREHDKLRADAGDFARRRTIAGPSRAADVAVMSYFRPDRHWGDVTLTNRSASDIRNLTILLTLSMKPPTDEPGAPFAAVAGLVAGLAGADSAAFQLLAVKTDLVLRREQVQEMVHLPVLPAGQTCRFKFVIDVSMRGTVDLAFATGAAYSMWADGTDVEDQALPGCAEAIEWAKQDAADPAGADARRRARWAKQFAEDPAAAREPAAESLAYAKRQLARQDDQRAKTAFESTVEEYPGSPEAAEASRALAAMDRR